MEDAIEGIGHNNIQLVPRTKTYREHSKARIVSYKIVQGPKASTAALTQTV